MTGNVDAEDHVSVSTRRVSRGYLTAGLVTAALLLLGIGAGFVCAQLAPNPVKYWGGWVQLCSGAFFLWGVLGLRGWEIQTFGGETEPEQRNLWYYRWLNGLGMLVLFTSSAAMLFVGNH